jgi:hypothetical protein
LRGLIPFASLGERVAGGGKLLCASSFQPVVNRFCPKGNDEHRDKN